MASSPGPALRPTQAFLDATSVRALAHPLRNRILGRLRTEGPATSTTLAARLGTNTGTTSYHLRKLAEIGMVTEDIGAGDGRDRWWKAAHEFTTWSQAQFRDDPDARAAADWLIGYQLRTITERTQAWLDVQHEWPTSWLEAADISDYRLYLTSEQAKTLDRELQEVLLRHLQAGKAAVAAGAPTAATGAPPENADTLVPVAFMLQLHPDVRT